MAETVQPESSLISLSPHDCLNFDLIEGGGGSKAVLQVSNVSKHKLIFKVKTRRSKWFTVSPVQLMLNVGQSAVVTILLSPDECRDFLKDPSLVVEETKQKLFLVQSVAVKDDEYSRIMELPPAKRTDEFTKLWEVDASQLNQLRLKVGFNFPVGTTNDKGGVGGGSGRNNNEGGSQSSSSPAKSLSAGIDAIRDKVAASVGELPRSASGSASGSGSGSRDIKDGDTAAEGSRQIPSAVFTELQDIRTKYDKILEYTCLLTVERDTIASQLKESKRAVARLKEEQKDIGAEGFATAVDGDNATRKKSSSDKTGFSLFFLLLMMFLSFVLGRFLRSTA